MNDLTYKLMNLYSIFIIMTFTYAKYKKYVNVLYSPTCVTAMKPGILFHFPPPYNNVNNVCRELLHS